MKRLMACVSVVMTFGLLSLGTSVAIAAAPTILTVSFSLVAINSVVINAEINPGKKATIYHVEYGSAPCSANPCFSEPIPDRKIAPGELPVDVAVGIAGLIPEATYFFRIVAKNGDGTTIGSDRAFTLHARCGNDESRSLAGSNLPNCRAYEQASPVDKGGGDVAGMVPFVKAAQNGGRVTFLSSSGIPGGVGAQELPLYLASRDDGGWSSQGLLPPGATGQLAKVLGWTLDFSKVFSFATALGEPPVTTLFARDTAGGQPVTVAPYVEKLAPQFAGASADGSTSIFESPAKLPGINAAIDGKSNVYAWNEASGTLKLASVFNDGNAPSKGALAGPYDWVTGTNSSGLALGGAARKYYLQDEHAVSSDGSVFFTAAGTGQLYLRRNPTEAQSPLDEGQCTIAALACTIPISASEKTNGLGPGGTDVNGPLPAAFQAASPDGTRAFFTSAEKLTNDANTGPEVVITPTFGRANIDGSAPDEAFMTRRGRWLAVDGTYIYWTDPNEGTIGRAELDGSNPEPEFITGLSDPQGIAVDSGHIYWSNAGTNSIGRADLNGSLLSIEPLCVEGASNPRGVDVDLSHIYWTNMDTHSIGRSELNCEGSDQSFVQRAESSILEGIVVNSSSIFFTEMESTKSFVGRVDITGESDSYRYLEVGGGRRIRDVAVTPAKVRWTTQEPNAIGQANLDLSERESEFLPLANPPSGLALDSSTLYWGVNQEAATNPGNDLYRFDRNINTGGLTDISIPDSTVPGSTNPNGAEVVGVLGASTDGSFIYFAANGVLTTNPNDHGESASPGGCAKSPGSAGGTCNLYLAHDGAITLVARLDSSGGLGETDAANWASTPEAFIGARFQATARVTPDGQTLLFRSQRQLSSQVTVGIPELYRYRVGEPGVICVSCNPTGAALTRGPTLGSITPAAATPGTQAAVLSRSLSSSGDQVFFETTEALVGDDTNGEVSCPVEGSFIQGFRSCQDVYEWEAEGSSSCPVATAIGGCLYLLSTGNSAHASFFADASASGEDAFLFSRSQLVGQDVDDLLDVYDTRVGGGLASQRGEFKPICEGLDSCHGPAAPAPAVESPGSPSLQGPPNPKPNRHPKKKKHKKHKQKQKHHRAHANRGAHQ